MGRRPGRSPLGTEPLVLGLKPVLWFCPWCRRLVLHSINPAHDPERKYAEAERFYRVHVASHARDQS